MNGRVSSPRKEDVGDQKDEVMELQGVLGGTGNSPGSSSGIPSAGRRKSRFSMLGLAKCDYFFVRL